MKGLMQTVLMAVLCVSIINGKIPKKFKSKEDKSLYCNVCETIMIDVETVLMEHVSDLSGTVSAYKMDSKGNRKRKVFSYELDTDDIDDAIDNVCSSWGSNLGTSTGNDGNVIMLKSGSLSGSFSGTLNFGGDASAKVLDICKSNIKKQRKNMVNVIANNDFSEVQSFCKNFVNKKCKKIEFPKDIAKQMKDLGVKSAAQEDEDEIELEDHSDL